MKRPSLTGVAIGIFVLLWVLILPTRLNVPMEETLSHDAGAYSNLAMHLVQDGMYSADGVTPFFAREPGMSLWLAAIYAVFGVENRLAIFVMQGLLFLVAALLFTREMTQHVGKRSAEMGLLVLVILAPMYHAEFSLYREGFALSLAIFFVTASLHCIRTRSVWSACLAGVLLGALTLTYTTFLLFPVFLIPLFLFLRIGWKPLLLLLFFFVLTLAPWGIRNAIHTGSSCLTGCGRSAIQWYVRGVQTRDLHGLEPFRCLYSEYVSRDWTDRSPSCSFNRVMHEKWPNSFQGTPQDVYAGVEGKQMITDNFLNYLWLAVVETVELHIPYVNGWGRYYNITAVLTTVILYFGIVWAIPEVLRRRPYALFLGSLILYHIGIFALTDATPRYLLPVLVCYSAVSGVGYARLGSRLFPWNA